MRLSVRGTRAFTRDSAGTLSVFRKARDSAACGCDDCAEGAVGNSYPDPELDTFAPGYEAPVVDGFHESDRLHQIQLRSMNQQNRLRWEGGW